jgi:hypothetical protein
MDWPSVAQYVELCLSVILIARLLSLGLHRVYRYFSFFLLADISGTLLWVADRRLEGTPIYVDYRILWLGDLAAIWIFTFLTVYALLDAILAQLPGILKLSHRVLNLSFLVALGVALGTALPEYRAAIMTEALPDRLGHLIAGAIVLDRVVATVALVTLLVITIFLIWFPVNMSRNLLTFFSGFVVYFSLRACLNLAVSLRSNGAADFVRFTNLLSAAIVSAIFAGWAIFLSKAGETVPAKVRLAPWRKNEQDLLVAQLHAMNASLLRAARR